MHTTAINEGTPTEIRIHHHGDWSDGAEVCFREPEHPNADESGWTRVLLPAWIARRLLDPSDDTEEMGMYQMVKALYEGRAPKGRRV